MFGDPSGMEPINLGRDFWLIISGVVVGGIISAWIQRISLNEARQQRSEDRKEKRKALGYSALLKTQKITNNIYALHKYVEDAYKNAAKHNLEGEGWAIVRSPANLLAQVNFSTEEMTLILSLSNADLFNRLIGIDETHNGYIEAFSFFGARRREFLDQLPAKMKGYIGTVGFSQEDYEKFRPRMVEVNEILKDLRVGLSSDYKIACKLMESLQETLRSELEISVAVKFVGGDYKPAQRSS